MWTIEPRKKKLRIQKYPDTCGRGLSVMSAPTDLKALVGTFLTLKGLKTNWVLIAAVAFRNVAVSTGGALGARDPGELPRSRKLVYDLKNKMKKVDDVDELLLYAKHSEEPIVLEHHDVPEDLWVLAKPLMTKDLSSFCTSDKLSHPLSVDPAFNFGKFEVTPFTSQASVP